MDTNESGFEIANISHEDYARVRRLANHYMRRERKAHTYRPTELVNEALARIMSAEIPLVNQRHFLVTCALQMKRILLNYAKAKRRAKRGPTESLTPDIEASLCVDEPYIDAFIEIDNLISCLEKHDKEACDAILLCYFVGATVEEASLLLRVSESTVTRNLRFGRAWIEKQIKWQPAVRN